MIVPRHRLEPKPCRFQVVVILKRAKYLKSFLSAGSIKGRLAFRKAAFFVCRLLAMQGREQLSQSY
jgi:hypothetical protein